MSEQPARRYVVYVEQRYGLDVGLVGLIYADVWMAHLQHGNGREPAFEALLACIQVFKEISLTRRF